MVFQVIVVLAGNEQMMMNTRARRGVRICGANARMTVATWDTAKLSGATVMHAAFMLSVSAAPPMTQRETTNCLHRLVGTVR